MNDGQTDLRQVVAGEVRAHLGRAGMSGYQAAEKLGWTQPYISRRLSGRVPFTVTDLGAIAELLGVPVSSFFEVPAGSRIRRPGYCRGLAAAA